MKKLASYQKRLKNRSPEEIIQWSYQEFDTSRITLATSFGLEDQLITHIAANIDKNCHVFTLDTGRLFQETYDIMQKTLDLYGISIEVAAPDANDITKMLSTKGPNLFYNSIEERKYCCNVRKLKPLTRILNSVDAWITGLRGDQSITRIGTNEIEWDEKHQIYKINPLCRWSESKTWSFIRDKKIPYNVLHNEGFPSIGCQPCTRAVPEGGSVRDGRWWWEKPESKECGLHQ